MNYIPRNKLWGSGEAMVDALAEKLYNSNPPKGSNSPRLSWFQAYSTAYDILKERLTDRFAFFNGDQDPAGRSEAQGESSDG